jgi:ribosomal-protein-alanine N-acetyltransferase
MIRRSIGSAISKAGPLQATVLSAIHARAFADDEFWDERIIAGQLSQPGVFGLLDKRGGMLLARLAADEAEVLTVAVVPERRQQGLGGGLMQAAAAEARARGATRLFLEVSTRNPAARGLYQGLGFAQVGRRKGYYANGADALVLSKDLTNR